MPYFILGVPEIKKISDKKTIMFKDIVDAIYDEMVSDSIINELGTTETVIILPGDIFHDSDISKKLADNYHVNIADYIASRIYDKLHESQKGTKGDLLWMRIFITDAFAEDGYGNPKYYVQSGKYVPSMEEIDSKEYFIGKEEWENAFEKGIGNVGTVDDFFIEGEDIEKLPPFVDGRQFLIDSEILNYNIYTLSLFKEGRVIPWVNRTIKTSWSSKLFLPPMLLLGWYTQKFNREYSFFVIGKPDYKNGDGSKEVENMGFIPFLYFEKDEYEDGDEERGSIEEVYGMAILEYNPEFYEYSEDIFYMHLPSDDNMTKNLVNGIMEPVNGRYYIISNEFTTSKIYVPIEHTKDEVTR